MAPPAAIRAVVSDAGLALQIPNDRAALEPVRLAVLDYLGGHALSAKAVFRMELILEEILMNAIWHAYADAGTHRIDLTVLLTPDEVRLHFEDDGIPFNPLLADAPQLPSSLDAAVPGGLGLMLVKKYAGRLAYERLHERNSLTVAVARQ